MPPTRPLHGSTIAGTEARPLPFLLVYAGDFTLVEEKEVPFVIREHRRKFQWGVSHATVWRRN